MGGETERDVSGWTVDTLRVHVLTRVEDLRNLMDERSAASEKAVHAALTSAEKAVTKAEVATEKRIEGLNELRQVVADISALQMPRAEAEQRIGAVDNGLDELKERVGRMESLKQGGKDTVSGIYALAAFIVTVVVIGTVLAANGVFTK